MAVQRPEPDASVDAAADAAELRRVAESSGMPIDARERVRPGAATIHACRAVVAVRLRWPEREAAFLRRLRVLIMAGEPADDSDTFELAATQTGLPVRELAAFAGEPEVEAALRADMAAAHGRPCPSFEGEHRLSELARSRDPATPAEVLEWAGIPLATAEVAAVCDRSLADVRAKLARSARFEPVGTDGYWH
jgi:protein-disulfide isomerase-like protein with CxxC motif